MSGRFKFCCMGTRSFTVQNPIPQSFQPKKFLLGQREVLFYAAATKPAKVASVTSTSGMTKPFLSVIIPAHNEEHYIGKTLEALHRQTFNSFEIVVIANGCSDHTAEVARGRCDQL